MMNERSVPIMRMTRDQAKEGAVSLRLAVAVIAVITVGALALTPAADFTNFDSDDALSETVAHDSAGLALFGLARSKKRRRQTFKPGRPKKYEAPEDMPAGEAGIIRWRNDDPGIRRRIKALVKNRNAYETYTGKTATDARAEAQQQVRRGVADPAKGDYIEFQKAHGPDDKQKVDDIDAKEREKGTERKPLNNDPTKYGVGRKPDYYTEGEGDQ